VTHPLADNTSSPDEPVIDPGARPGRLHTPMQWVRFIARSGKRILVLLLGCCVLGAGIAMLALPGPGLLVIIVGLAILATEFAWAERMLDKAAGGAHAASNKLSSNRRSRLMLLASASALVVGGAAVMVLVPQWRMVGLSVLLAGSIGLATQHPAVERWLAGRSRIPVSAPPATAPSPTASFPAAVTSFAAAPVPTSTSGTPTTDTEVPS
jgi:uncharacterized protein (TIGR02611 family)